MSYGSGHRELQAVIKTLEKHKERIAIDRTVIYWVSDSKNVNHFLSLRNIKHLKGIPFYIPYFCLTQKNANKKETWQQKMCCLSLFEMSSSHFRIRCLGFLKSRFGQSIRLVLAHYLAKNRIRTPVLIVYSFCIHHCTVTD